MFVNNNYSCIICNKQYKSYQSIWNHNNRYHPDKDIIIKPIDNKVRNYECTKCSRKFTTKHCMQVHILNKCKNKDVDNKTSQLESKIEKLEKKLEQLENKTVTTTNNTINNGTVNNIIYINKIGSENIYDLNDTEIKEIFSKNFEKSVLKFVEYLNFNSRLPSNHNFCTTSLDGQYLSVYNTDQPNIGEQKERKKYFFEDLLRRSVNRMEQLYNKYKKKFDKNKQKQIEEDISTLKVIRDKNMSDTLLREMLKKLNLLSYNYKEIVLQTWSQPDTTAVKEKTFEEDLEEDDTDIKEIESLFINPSNDMDNHFTEIICNHDSNTSDSDSDTSSIPKLLLTKKKNIIV